MVFVQECQPKQEGRCWLVEEKKEERFLAHNLSHSRQQYNSLDLIHTCKYFRLFFKESKKTGLEISISKKNFKYAVDRNKIKRRIKEIFREKSLLDSVGGVIVFSVFRPFEELSYSDALVKIEGVVGLYMNNKKLLK
jgi:ribonuclease P protein component